MRWLKDALYDALREATGHIEGAMEIPCGLYDPSMRSLSYLSPPGFCEGCRRCDYISTHLYGCYEAERWDSKYIYYCPMGLVFLANVVPAGMSFEAGIVSGPLLMGEPEDVLPDIPEDLRPAAVRLPNVSTRRANHICELIHAVALSLSDEDAQARRSSAAASNRFRNQLYELSDSVREHGAPVYPIQYEKKLQTLIANGNKEGSQELLNQLLGYIYFTSNADLRIIKARVNELLVLLSRAAIEGGADVDQIFWMNNGLIDELMSFTDVDHLNEWLTRVMHRFVGYVFDFTNIKHIDVIHKAVDYIKRNCSAKLTLDDVAAEVFLSKSYLSKIFKEELGQTFSNYVNTVRVEQSKPLLLEGKLSLAEIANIIGFEDQSYFTKVFKKMVGVSPGRFRESRGKTY